MLIAKIICFQDVNRSSVWMLNKLWWNFIEIRPKLTHDIKKNIYFITNTIYLYSLFRYLPVHRTKCNNKIRLKKKKKQVPVSEQYSVPLSLVTPEIHPSSNSCSHMPFWDSLCLKPWVCSVWWWPSCCSSPSKKCQH